MNFIENETAEKLRGGYYTPPDIAAFLARWITQTSPRSILEPSCGDGAFIRALEAVGASSTHVTACELSVIEAAKARRTAHKIRGLHATVIPGDFLAWVLERLDSPPMYDAVLGNPPFVRYQYLTDEIQERAELVIRHFGLRFTKHTNAWVPFVVASIARLKPGGRLAMVVPSELLHVLHADSAREYLLRECSRVLVVDPEEIWFEDTLQGVVLLLAEKKAEGASARPGRLAILRTRGKEFMSEDPGRIFDKADYLEGDAFPHKWTHALLTASERRALASLQEHSSVKRFSDIAKAAVGIVTGANQFFLVPDSVVEEYDLQDFAHPMFGRSEHVPGVLYDLKTHADNKRLGLPANFLWFDKGVLPAGARRYIELGESEGLQKRFKCRVREPWYRVPSVFTCPVGMLKRSHDCPRLVLNTAEAYTTDTAYRITPHGVRPAQLVYGFVNSLTALSCELEGRHYGGGVLELVPSEIARLLIPVVPGTMADVKRLDALYRGQTSVAHILEYQDREILTQLGVSARARQDLLCAWWAMRNRRQRVATEIEQEDDTGQPRHGVAKSSRNLGT